MSLGSQGLNSIYSLISYFDCRASTKQQDQHSLLKTCGCGIQNNVETGLNELQRQSDIFRNLQAIIRGNCFIQQMRNISDH